MKKQRSASPSQAMPRSAPVERTRSMISPPVLLQQRVRLVVGELAVGLEVHLLQLQRQLFAGSAPTIGPPMPLPPSTHDLHRLDRAGSMKPSAWARNSSQMSTSSSEPPPGASPSPASIVARGRRRSRRRRRAAARPRGRASRRCRPSGCATRSPSRRRRAPASRPGGRASRWRPCPASITVAPSTIIPSRSSAAIFGAVSRMSRPRPIRSSPRRLVAQPCQDAHESAPDVVRDALVDLLAVDAADVVGLEDPRVQLHCRPLQCGVALLDRLRHHFGVRDHRHEVVVARRRFPSFRPPPSRRAW